MLVHAVCVSARSTRVPWTWVEMFPRAERGWKRFRGHNGGVLGTGLERRNRRLEDLKLRKMDRWRPRYNGSRTCVAVPLYHSVDSMMQTSQCRNDVSEGGQRALAVEG
jgi:hypothetical protein